MKEKVPLVLSRGLEQKQIGQKTPAPHAPKVTGDVW